MKKILALFVVAAFAASATVCLAAEPAKAPAAPAPPPVANKPGVAVPAWETKALQSGDVYSSAKLAGKPYAIVFVNNSCASCRAELDQLKQRQFGDKLTVLLAAVDAKPERVIGDYRDQLKVTFPIIDDSKFTLARNFGIAFTPASVIVGADGKVLHWFAGFTDENKAQIIGAYDAYVK